MLYTLLFAAMPAVAAPQAPYVVVLGVAQDAGHPQAGCEASHCKAAWEDPRKAHRAASLGLVEPSTGRQWIFDATPDLPEQLYALQQTTGAGQDSSLGGVFLTHAHIGHYTGLMHLGREVMGAQNIPVYTMPRMGAFIETNGPWSQLVKLENIRLESCAEPVTLADNLSVESFLVPHRDEFSETVGFRIKGPSKTIVYLPDIDKWDRWDTPLSTLLADVDIAYLDGTFFADGELGNRDMSQIPHPFMAETMALLHPLPAKVRAKVHFIHLNHTNPALDPTSEASKTVQKNGFNLATEGDITKL
jgi:pyrroloquinoline quinone biosynthesis protein B